MGQDITPKIGNGYRKRYDTREEERTGKSYRPSGTQSQTYYTIQESRKNGQYLPMKGTGNGQDGNGGDEGRDDEKGNLEITNMTLKIRKMRKMIQKIPVS